MSNKIIILRERFALRMAVVSLVVMILLLTTGFVWANKKVYIAVDGQKIAVSTLSANPEQIISEAEVKMGPKDEYRLSGSRLADNATIHIYRAVPVTVTYHGQTFETITGKPTTTEIVASLGLPIKGTKVTPGPQIEVIAGMQIKVVDITQKTIEQDQSIARDVIRRADPDLAKGEQEVVQEGQDGVEHVVIQQTYEDGQPTEQTVLSQKVIAPSTPMIVKVGSNDTVATSRGAVRFKQELDMRASAYLPTDGDGACITATGTRATYGTVAVDPDVIPLGSRLYIPGYGFAVASDTGGAIQGNRIDLCMEDYGDAMDFGRRDVKVYILS